MAWQWLANSILRSSVRDRVLRTVVDQAQQQAADAGRRRDAADAPSGVAFVFALTNESGSLEDRYTGLVVNQAQGLRVALAQHDHAALAIATVGVGPAAAARGTEALIRAHAPKLLVSAGFAGGLVDDLPRNTLFLADRIVDDSGQDYRPTSHRDLAPLLDAADCRRGTLLTSHRVVRTEQEKRKLADATSAHAVDMETAAVAAVCNTHDVPWLSVRIILDAVDDTLPAAVEKLARQKTAAGRWGAALGQVVSDPQSVKQLWNLNQRSLVAADHLADFLVRLVAPHDDSGNTTDA